MLYFNKTLLNINGEPREHLKLPLFCLKDEDTLATSFSLILNTNEFIVSLAEDMALSWLKKKKKTQNYIVKHN